MGVTVKRQHQAGKATKIDTKATALRVLSGVTLSKIVIQDLMQPNEPLGYTAIICRRKMYGDLSPLSAKREACHGLYKA
ncbi:hypothetical protein VTN96DRAFT_7358 [Rasamsonia emersonii]